MAQTTDHNRQLDIADSGEMAYGEDFGAPIEEFEDTSLPNFKIHHPVTTFVMIAVFLFILTLFLIITILVIISNPAGEWVFMMILLTVMTLLNLLVWGHIHFLKKMGLTDQPRGMVLKQLEVGAEERLRLKPQLYLIPISYCVFLFIFLGLVSSGGFDSVILAILIIVGVTLGFLYNFFKPRNYLVTDQGFGFYLSAKRPMLFFWPWEGFKGFTRKGDLIKLRPKHFNLFQNFSVEAGESVRRLEFIFESNLPREN